jgi:hypothetical protein
MANPDMTGEEVAAVMAALDQPLGTEDVPAPDARAALSAWRRSARAFVPHDAPATDGFGRPPR